MAYIQLLGGLIYLLMGGDLMVRGAVALARKTHVPPVVIALSLVAFGTSLPELVVTIQAVVDGYPAIAIGNVVGSNIANVLLVVGVPALFFPLTLTERSAGRDAVVMLAVGAMFLVLCLLGDIDRSGGIVLLAILAVVAGVTARATARQQRHVDRSLPMEQVLGLPTNIWMIALFVVAGAVGLPLGARMFVQAAVLVAAQLQISDAAVGLTIVAVGTSLPELATSLVATLQRQTGVAMGTAVGSNIFNILAIMGAAAALSPVPIPVPPRFLLLDLPLMLSASLLLTLFVLGRRPIGRLTGVGLITAYGAYLTLLFSVG